MTDFHIQNVQDWGLYLVEKYPLILKEFDADVAYYFKGDPKEMVNLRYGWECESGWKFLIEEFLAKATDIVERARKEDRLAYIHGFIAKQKMGSFRWLGNSKLPEKFEQEFEEVLSDIEIRSFETCEYCGQPGKVRATKEGWLEVKCLDCKEK